jgi:hypothetical protein
MEAKLLVPILATLVMFMLGYCVIRLLNLNLPRPQSFREFMMFTFWIYPQSWDRRKIRANKLAWFVVVFVTYVTITTVFL